jgi:hypothetical protein
MSDERTVVPLKRLLFLPCLLILSALALSACGGGSDSTGGGDDSPESKVEAVVEASSLDSDPANCTETNTQNFNEQLVHEEGAGATKACEAEAEDGTAAADSVEFTNVKVNGDAATLDAAFEGGLYGGQTIAVSVVKEGDTWKVDEITKIVKLDSSALAETFQSQLDSTGELTDEQVSCITDGIGGASQADVEDLLLSGSAEPFIKLATGCA